MQLSTAFQTRPKIQIQKQVQSSISPVTTPHLQTRVRTMATECYQSLSDCSLLWPHQDQRKGEAVHRRNRDTEMAGPARWVLRTKELWD